MIANIQIEGHLSDVAAEMINLLAQEVSPWGNETISEIRDRIYAQAYRNIKARGLSVEGLPVPGVLVTR